MARLRACSAAQPLARAAALVNPVTPQTGTARQRGTKLTKGFKKLLELWIAGRRVFANLVVGYDTVLKNECNIILKKIRKNV